MIIALIILFAFLLATLADMGITLVEKKLHPLKYEEYVERYASEYNVPEYVIFAVINTESGFDPNAESSAGAFGLMQMMPSTQKYLATDAHLDEDTDFEDLADPDVAIRYGTYYLRYLFDKFHKWSVVFAAYNAGEGRVSEWLDEPKYSEDGETLKKIPIRETRNYVKKVNKAIDYYKDTYYRNGVSVK